MDNKTSAALDARKCLRASHVGALATLSVRLRGHPYASVVPFITDHQANPIILISRLAEHTKNIHADQRVSLLAHDTGVDVQALARVTVVGHCTQANDAEKLATRYLRYFPDAARLLDLDFAFYRITPTSIRFIGGFGTIHWLGGDALMPAANTIADVEASAIEHMNIDHQKALLHYCERLHQFTPSAVLMVGLDCDGIDVRADDRLLRIEFPHPVFDAQSVRSVLADLARGSAD
jgi:putative heme iron utilization protein